MPRKPKSEKQVRAFVVNGKDLRVSFFPPKGKQKSWQAYWTGLPTRKSTKAMTFDGAVDAVKQMLFGDDSAGIGAVMSDDEFDQVQREHYKRVEATLETVASCFEAVEAFRAVTKVVPICLATPEDCARFQDEALKLPKNWRAPFKSDDSRKERTHESSLGSIKRSTVLKWSTALRAAFNRVNLNAGKKCIRNVVTEGKLLRKNPWDEIVWITDKSTPVPRQFSHDELLSFLDYLENSFGKMTCAAAAAKVFLWSCARRTEIAELKWSQLRLFDGEVHFDIVGKWRVRRWFRIPSTLYDDLLGLKSEGSPFVFASYSEQVRNHHSNSRSPNRASKIRADFVPANFGEWLYHRVREWSKSQSNETAYLHAFRKTGLQFAVDGEATNKRVAADARVNVGVMTTHYTFEQEQHLRDGSNRMFERISRSLPEHVLVRYSYKPQKADPLEVALNDAVRNQDWLEVKRISDLLCQRKQSV